MRWLKSKQIIGSRFEGIKKKPDGSQDVLFCLHLDFDLQIIRVLLMFSIVCLFKKKRQKQSESGNKETKNQKDVKDVLKF